MKKMSPYTTIPGTDIEISNAIETKCGLRLTQLTQQCRNAWVWSDQMVENPAATFKHLASEGLSIDTQKVKTAVKAAVRTHDAYQPGHVILHQGLYLDTPNPVYVLSDGRIVGDPGVPNVVVLFGDAKSKPPTGKFKPARKAIEPLLSRHPALVALLGLAALGPVLRLRKSDQPPIVVEFTASQSAALDLAVKVVTQFAGPSFTLHCPGKDVPDDCRAHLLRGDDGLVVINAWHRVPAKLRKRLVLLEDIASAGDIDWAHCDPRAVVLIPTMTPLMQDAHEATEIANKQQSLFISLHLDPKTCDALTNPDDAVWAALAQCQGVAGAKLVQRLVNDLSKAGGLETLQNELEDQIIEFGKEAETSGLQPPNERALTSWALIFAAAKYAQSHKLLPKGLDVTSAILTLYRKSCLSADPTLDALLTVISDNKDRIYTLKAGKIKSIDPKRDALAYRNPEETGGVTYWFKPKRLKEKLGTQAKQIMADLRSRGILDAEGNTKGRFSKHTPKGIGLNGKRMIKITLPEAPTMD